MPRRRLVPDTRNVLAPVSTLSPQDNHAVVRLVLRCAARAPSRAEGDVADVCAALGLDVPVALAYERHRRLALDATGVMPQ